VTLIKTNHQFCKQVFRVRNEVKKHNTDKMNQMCMRD